VGGYLYYLFLVNYFFFMNDLKGKKGSSMNLKNLVKGKQKTSYAHMHERDKSQRYLEDWKKEVFGKTVSKKEMLDTVIMLYGTPEEAKEKKLPHLRSLLDLPPIPDQEDFKNKFLNLLQENKKPSRFSFFSKLKNKLKVFYNSLRLSYSRILFFDNFVLFLSYFRSIFKFCFSVFFFVLFNFGFSFYFIPKTEFLEFFF
jgi:hypothetical protein